MDLILVAVISLGAIGLIAAVILYAASKKFAVYEDPRIAKVSEVLPQANCGGCGYPGCSGFAGAPICCDKGNTACLGSARVSMALPADNLFSAGCTPPILNVFTVISF